MPKSLPHAASSSSSSWPGEAALCSPSTPNDGQSPMQAEGRHQLAPAPVVVAALAQAVSKLHAWMLRHRIQQLLLG
jgi:hypothetical protein